MKFSILDRQEQLGRLETVDVLVIGGGITGAGVTLDAVTRGLSVCCIEMQDFAAGTSSRSTKLVHGGLRYLKQFEVKEVAELGRERAIVYENAPHVTTPMWMMLPFHKFGTFGPVMTALGLKTYDVLANVRKKERRFMLSAEETLKREPLIRQEDLLGSGVYVEYRTDDARLTLEVLKAAVARGAQVYNYMEVVALTKKAALFVVTAYDHLQKREVTFYARQVVNAAGPWVDRVLALEEATSHKKMMLSKGVHLVFSQSVFPLEHGVYFDTEHDGRMIFAIPRDGKIYVGTTDTLYEGDPKEIVVTADDKKYLLQAIRYMFPNVQVSENNIESTWAGVRPLVYEEGKSLSEVSRKDELWVTDGGVVTIAGGKLTGYRKMAEKVVDVVASNIGSKARSVTKHLPLSGGDLGGSRFFDTYIQKKTARGIRLGLAESMAEKLVRQYGTNIDVLYSYYDKTALRPDVHMQLHYAVHHESAATAVDFLLRRTGALLFDMHLVEHLQQYVMDEMTRLLGWDAQERAERQAELQRAITLAKAKEEFE